MATKKKTAKKKAPKKATKKVVPKKPAKKKAAPKKKTIKSVPNPHTGKRYFKIEVAGYGGDLAIGRASEEFVKYWQDEDRKSELENHIWAMNQMAMFGDITDEDDEEVERDEEEGYDKNSPAVHKGTGLLEFNSFDDFEGGLRVSADYNNFTVSEIELHPQAIYENSGVTWDSKYCSKKSFDWSQELYKDVPNTEQEIKIDRVVYRRELFIEDDKKVPEKPVPAIMCYDAQKGVFGHLFVMTNGEDFDANKMAIAICDNTMTDSIVGYYYDKYELDMDTNYLSTSGKGFNACVGYLHHYDTEHNREANLQEGWADLAEQESGK